jgi:hypothetical protein
MDTRKSKDTIDTHKKAVVNSVYTDYDNKGVDRGLVGLWENK